MGDWNRRYIGLFTNNKWAGEGNFCGYYGAEYYLDTTLLAYGIQLREGSKSNNFKAPFDGGFFENVNKHYDKIGIGCDMWEKHIEADSVEEALEIFKTQSWQILKQDFQRIEYEASV